MTNCWNLWMQGGMSSMMWLGLFWIILLIVVVYFILKLLSNQTEDRGGRETPLDILQKEFARGTISEEEYLKRKKHLE